jgi:hypothetical protein
MSTAESEEKECTTCGQMMSVSCFYATSGREGACSAKCKECIRIYGAQKRAADRMDIDVVPDDQEPTKRSKFSEATVAGADLYIMAISTDPTGEFHGLKVGRSGNVPQRAASLSESLPFNILVLTTLTNMGYLEKHIHAQLDPTRNATGRGREWFHASLPIILHTAACLLQSRPKVNAGSTGTAPVAPPAE